MYFFFCDIYWYVYSVVYLAPIPHRHSDVSILRLIAVNIGNFNDRI